MERGGIYNLVYVGENHAYGRINGKRTIRVLEITPKLQYVNLFDQFGKALSDDLAYGPITVENQDIAFKDDEIYEPADESEWLKHALKVGSLTEALKHGVTEADIAEYRGLVPIIGRTDVLGVRASFQVEDRLADRPLLQCVFIVWKNWEATYADFDAHGVNIRR